MLRVTATMILLAFSLALQEPAVGQSTDDTTSLVNWSSDAEILGGHSNECGHSHSPSTLFAWPGTDCYFSSAPNTSDPLASDRPQFTESVWTVGRGVGQFEMGYLYTFDDEAAGSVRSNQIPISVATYTLLSVQGEHSGPRLRRPPGWGKRVNTALTKKELDRVRECVQRGLYVW